MAIEDAPSAPVHRRVVLVVLLQWTSRDLLNEKPVTFLEIIDQQARHPSHVVLRLDHPQGECAYCRITDIFQGINSPDNYHPYSAFCAIASDPFILCTKVLFYDSQVEAKSFSQRHQLAEIQREASVLEGCQ